MMGDIGCVRLLPVVGLLYAGAADCVSAQERLWLPDPVESAVFVDVEGDLLGNPQSIRASPDGGFVVADWADFAIRAFNATGEPMWRFGRAGGGPGEFLRFDDLEYDHDGQLLVLDSDNLRLTVLDSNGSLVGSLRLPQSEVHQVMPSSFSPGDRVVTPRDRGEALWLAISSAGRMTRSGPASPFAFNRPIEAESWAAPLPGGGAVIVFRWSSQMILLGSEGDIRATVDGIEPIQFAEATTEYPDVEVGGIRITSVTRIDRESAIEGTRAATADASRLYVLFDGATEDAGRIVDTYDASDGSYLGSYRLPDRTYLDIAILADGRFATLDAELYPTVRLWSLR